MVGAAQLQPLCGSTTKTSAGKEKSRAQTDTTEAHKLSVEKVISLIGGLVWSGLPIFPLKTSPKPRGTHLSWAKKVMFKTTKKGNIGTPVWTFPVLQMHWSHTLGIT